MPWTGVDCDSVIKLMVRTRNSFFLDDTFEYEYFALALYWLGGCVGVSVVGRSSS
ncbi:hypothetical protein JYU34_001297, partial [Plutella xylostella]